VFQRNPSIDFSYVHYNPQDLLKDVFYHFFLPLILSVCPLLPHLSFSVVPHNPSHWQHRADNLPNKKIVSMLASFTYCITVSMWWNTEILILGISIVWICFPKMNLPTLMVPTLQEFLGDLFMPFLVLYFNFTEFLNKKYIFKRQGVS